MNRQTYSRISLSLFGITLIGIIAFAVLAGGTDRSAAANQAQVQATNGRLAFTSDGFLYTINANGTNQLQLTSDGSNHSPAWSPDGSRIAFNRAGPQDSTNSIYVINSDGNGLHKISITGPGDADPTWSPDGTRIAFQSTSNNNADIFVMNADGTNRIDLTNNPAIDLSPSWSPDGSRIAFVSTRDSPEFEIYVMNADGSNSTRLTNNSVQDADPSWSPDSTKLTFTTFRDGNFEIYSMNADGSSPVNLSNNSSSDFQPAWAPDGNRIAFLSFRDSVNNVPQEIYVMNSDGSSQTRVTHSSFAEQELAWQPLPGSPTPTPTPTASPSPSPAPDQRIVISQIYGGGGTTGATYQASFLEIFNRGKDAVDLRQWGIWFTSETGTFNSAVSFVGTRAITIQPGQHFLLQVGPSGTSGAPLPVTPEFVLTVVPSLGLTGKIAITRPQTGLGSVCPLPNAGISDLVGFGSTANCFEGSSPVGTLSNTSAAIRLDNGCKDTDNNTGDFSFGPPNPRNSLSPLSFCFNSVQFSATTYDAGEGVGAALITVTRTGDASLPATVDYSTSDLVATQTNDYEVATGTLSFASGETSKTFTVLIVDDVYFEGTETFNLQLSNPTEATLGSAGTATVSITDNDSSPPGINPLDNADAQFFVRQQYFDFLSRIPDASGFDFWTGQITQCGNSQTCLRDKRIDVSNAFFYEREYQQTGAYVYRLYRAAFGNNQPFPNPLPDPMHPNEEKKVVAYQAFVHDRARVVGGVDLAQSQLDLANAFVPRAEFTAKYNPAQDGPAFVDALLATVLNDIGVDLTAQRQALIGLFNQAGGGDRGRGVVLYRVADDSQTNPINNRAFIDAEYNRAFVATEYFGYLRRDPDMAGFLFWLGQVDGAPLRSVSRQHQMVCSFITAAEYQQRFSSVITHSNSECP